MKQIPQSQFERFDMKKKPQKQRLRFLIKLLSFPDVKKHKTKITKVNMDKVKPPYLLLVNHNAFYDFKVVERCVWPARTNSVVAIDGYIGREWLLRAVGCICKRKFTQDMTMIRHIAEVIKMGDVAVLYPEARYSLCGTNALLPTGCGKLAKMLDVPLVSIITKGNHVNSPFWNLHDNCLPTEATMTCLLSPEQLETMSAAEVNQVIAETFTYDDFAWQRDNKVVNAYPDRAKGLHKVLYKCPHCGEEYKTNSDKTEIWCEHCGKRWTMDEFGHLKANEGETEFKHIPDWYEWERACVRKEIDEKTYRFEATVRVDSLPNSKGYVNLGLATLTQDENGFVLKGRYADEDYVVKKSVESTYSVHIEYNYLGKHGDCVDINTIDDTFYCYPQDCLFSVTKIALATEELYKSKCGEAGLIVKK